MIKVTVGSGDKAQPPWWWRRRIGMTPFYFGLGVALLSAMSFSLSTGQTTAVVCAAGALSAFLANAKWGGKRADRAMLYFVWSVIGFAAAFILVVRYEVIEYGWIFVALTFGVLGLGTFWWRDNWNLKRVHLERDVERWPVLAKKLSMVNIKRGPEETTETGRRWRFWWDEGDFTLGAFKSKARELESALGIPENHIRFEHVYNRPGQKSPNTIYVVENTQSKNLETSRDFDRPTMRKITDPMLIGPFEDDEPHTITWYDLKFGGMHTLAGGATGSGKSGLYHLVTAESAYCPDLVRWGIDAKGGMALRPWASLYDWMIDDADDAVVMLLALQEVLKARSKYAASKGWSVWQADHEHPVLMVVIDEAAEVFGLDSFDTNDLGASVARMGRAAGVILLLATQHPTNESLGTNQLTKNVRRRFCFSVEDDAGQRAILPKSSGRIDATEIPIGPEYAGTYFCSDGGKLIEKSARVRYVTEEQIYALVQEVGNDPTKAVPDLDEISQNAARLATRDEESGESAYEQRRIWTVDDAIPPGSVQGDETFDPKVLGGERTSVQPAPEPLGELVQAGAPVPTPARAVLRAVPGQGGTDEGLAEESALPWIEEDKTMDLNAITEPTSAEEKSELDRAIAEYTARWDEGKVSPVEAQRLLDQMLADAPNDGVTIEDMRKTLPRSPSWYSNELRERLANKTIEKQGLGRYRSARKMVSVGDSR